MKNKIIITSTPRGHTSSVKQVLYDWYKLYLKQQRKQKLEKIEKISKNELHNSLEKHT